MDKTMNETEPTIETRYEIRFNIYQYGHNTPTRGKFTMNFKDFGGAFTYHNLLHKWLRMWKSNEAEMPLEYYEFVQSYVDDGFLMSVNPNIFKITTAITITPISNIAD